MSFFRHLPSPKPGPSGINSVTNMRSPSHLQVGMACLVPFLCETRLRYVSEIYVNMLMNIDI